MNQERLLKLLSDGHYHTGSELGATLGVTRAAIWKMLPNLQQLGVTIESSKSKGYRIPGGLDLLDLNSIQCLLDEGVKAKVEIHLPLICSSTNDVLSNLTLNEEHCSYLVCLTELQTSGRGRRGRKWISPFCSNILSSVAFVLEGGAEKLNGLSLVVGLAIAESLKSIGVPDVGLKWPNDVYINNKKVSGILLELSGEVTTTWKVVCGFGINVHMQQSDGKDIDQEWTALDEWTKKSRNEVAASVLNNIVDYIERFKVSGFPEFLDQWDRYDVLAGKQVTVMPSGLQGLVRGVNYKGALKLETESGLQEVNAGEVSVRLK